MLNSDIVGREVSVEEDFEHTGIIGSGHDSDSGPDSDYYSDYESDWGFDFDYHYGNNEF